MMAKVIQTEVHANAFLKDTDLLPFENTPKSKASTTKIKQIKREKKIDSLLMISPQD